MNRPTVAKVDIDGQAGASAVEYEKFKSRRPKKVCNWFKVMFVRACGGVLLPRYCLPWQLMQQAIPALADAPYANTSGGSAQRGNPGPVGLMASGGSL